MVLQRLERIHDQAQPGDESHPANPWSSRRLVSRGPDRQKYFCRFSCLVLA